MVSVFKFVKEETIINSCAGQLRQVVSGLGHIRETVQGGGLGTWGLSYMTRGDAPLHLK